ncbi:hypothetical protein MN608_01555 [Microdochium nivale]|nr:hypothetical protein MN608_01555 [Microdochium nivale]
MWRGRRHGRVCSAGKTPGVLIAIFSAALATTSTTHVGVPGTDLADSIAESIAITGDIHHHHHHHSLSLSAIAVGHRCPPWLSSMPSRKGPSALRRLAMIVTSRHHPRSTPTPTPMQT